MSIRYISNSKTSPRQCTHSSGPAVVTRVEEKAGSVARCLMCDTVGPVRRTSEEARGALLALGANNLARTSLGHRTLPATRSVGRDGNQSIVVRKLAGRSSN
jgi:hypothetical protein